MSDNEKNVVNVHKEDEKFIYDIMNLTLDKKSVVRGFLFGLEFRELQEKQNALGAVQ